MFVLDGYSTNMKLEICIPCYVNDVTTIHRLIRRAFYNSKTTEIETNGLYISLEISCYFGKIDRKRQTRERSEKGRQ